MTTPTDKAIIERDTLQKDFDYATGRIAELEARLTAAQSVEPKAVAVADDNEPNQTDVDLANEAIRQFKHREHQAWYRIARIFAEYRRKSSNAAIVADLTTANELLRARAVADKQQVRENNGVIDLLTKVSTGLADDVTAARAEIVALRETVERGAKAVDALLILAHQMVMTPLLREQNVMADMKAVLARTAADFAHLSVIPRAELAELVKDKARLDWINSNRTAIEVTAPENCTWTDWIIKLHAEGYGFGADENSLRAAIDAAMSSGQPEQGAK